MDEMSRSDLSTESNLPAVVENHRLTLRQQTFVEMYLGQCYGNATEAARLAGYSGSDNQLATIGWQNLRKPEIRAYVRDRLRTIIGSTDNILEQLWKIASAPVSAHMVVTKPATYDEDGTKLDSMHVRLDYSAKVRALELLMRYNRMLEDKAPVEVTVKAFVGVDLSRV